MVTHLVFNNIRIRIRDHHKCNEHLGIQHHRCSSINAGDEPDWDCIHHHLCWKSINILKRIFLFNNFFDPQLDNRPHLWSSWLKTFQPAVQEGKPDEPSVPTLWLWKIRKSTLRSTTVSEPQMKCKTFPLCSSAHIYLTENEKSKARCWISWWGDRTETLTVLRYERKAGVGCTWLCCLFGISAFIIPL